MEQKLTKNFLNTLLMPFGELFPQLIALTLFCSLFRCMYYLGDGGIKYAIYIIIWNSIISYGICLFSLLFKGIYRKIFFGIIATILTLYVIFESVLVIKYHTFLNEVTVTAILSTNLQEAIEMSNDALTFNYISKALICIIAVFCLYIIVLKLPRFSRKVQIILFIIFIISIPLGLRNNIVFLETPLFNLSYLFKSYDDPDLHDYLQHPQICQIKGESIPSIALIIGESHCKSHSSIYGYNKDTNPRLSKLLSSTDTISGKLFVFSNIKSPASNTVNSFKQILSTYNEKSDTNIWYNHCTIIEVMHIAGYKTNWISNQSKYGLYTNLIGKFSELCDTSLFVSPAKVLKNSFDEELIPLKKSLNSNNGKNFDIFHLVGSHADFKMRYPEDRIVFKESDYTGYPKSQRRTLMNYDNALVYNDSVIYEIIKLYDHEDAAVIYFPDHALDLYESRNDYAGHGIINDELSYRFGTQIPMLIYLSKSLCEKRPDIAQALETAKDKPYNTTNNIYTIMKLAGLKFADNDDVEKYALF